MSARSASAGPGLVAAARSEVLVTTCDDDLVDAAMDPKKLVAFGASGVLCTVVTVVVSLGDLRFVVVAAAYFLVFASAVSVVRPAVAVMGAAWGVAVVLSAVLMAVAGGLPGEVIVGALSLGTAGA